MNATTSTPADSELRPGRSVRPAIMLAALWGGLAALWNGHPLEPITGHGWPALIFTVGLNLALGFGVAWAFLSRAILLGCGLVPLVFFTLPAHSKAGATFTVSNHTSATTAVRISRADRPGRSATLKVEAGSQATHRTAPGDYSEAISVEFAVGDSRLTATIAQLRKSQVVLKNSGLELNELRRDEP